MAVLLDTNILLRLLQPQSDQAEIARQALDSLRLANQALYITAQNLVEFWAVATRTASENGLGLSIEQAVAETTDIKRLFHLLPEVPLLRECERLVSTYRVCGKSAHDARLVAAVLAHGVSTILNFNVQDFTRYSRIAVLDPRSVA